VSAPYAPDLEIVPLDDFIAVEEPGAQPLLGDEDGVVIPEGGDVMIYGPAGGGKTTLMSDLGCHLAAGDAWLGLPVPHAVCVALVENEGPRPLFRAKQSVTACTYSRTLGASSASPIPPGARRWPRRSATSRSTS
jgi:hypothetical protein